VIRDAIFAAAFWAVVGFAGYVIVGPVEGLALWRLFVLTGFAGFAHGYLTAESRELARVARMAAATRERLDELELDFDIDTDGQGAEALAGVTLASWPEERTDNKTRL
jgi:hypothetical protein